jgi:hypothetical protein
MSSFSETLTVTGPGEIVANVNYRSRDNRFTERFLVDHHSAVFKPLDLSYEPSPYYTGGGHYALVDGRLGSDNFRDGTWQAVQGGDMEMTVDLGEELFIDSISLNFYVYQDAWIFKPSILVLSTSSNGEVFEIIDVLEFGEASNTLEKNDFQGIVNLSTGRFENLKTRWIRVKAVNAGVCPDWHEAATEPTWIFVDELVVRKRI